MVAIGSLLLLSLTLRSVQPQDDILPLVFDARSVWLECGSISTMAAQGSCACSFAIAPTAVMTDRACIASKGGTSARTFSAADAAGCCQDCVINPGKRYLGGDPLAVWEMWLTQGLASEDCRPYPLNDYSDSDMTCVQSCIAGYNGTVTSDRVKGSSIYAVSPNELDIQIEIMVRGPVQASIELYGDFLVYSGGIYRHKEGPYLGEQAVKIIGWGHDGEDRYWLGITSFGMQWGSGGAFLIPRGENYLGVETSMKAGIP